ncbi:MAG: T9SS type A sorting domain-containing protein [Bacteroidota bacterium]
MKHLILTPVLLFCFAASLFSQCAPDAGPDDSGCGLVYTFSATLGDVGSTGTWTSNCPGAVFDDPNSASATVTIPVYGTNSVTWAFYWTEDNTVIPCSDVDTVVITFYQLPNAEAGGNHYVCETYFTLNADTIGGFYAITYWEALTPGVTFDDPADPYATADISAIIPGAYDSATCQVKIYFVWHVTSGATGCMGNDTMYTVFYRTPVAYAGEDDSICGKQYDLQAIESINCSTGMWSVVTKPAGSTVNFASIIDPTAHVTVSHYGTYEFQWQEANENNAMCMTRDTVTIEFLEIPNIDAGLDQDVCGHWAHLSANSSSGVGTWGYAPPGWATYPSIDSLNPAAQQMPDCWVYSGTQNITVGFVWQEWNSWCVAQDSCYITFWKDNVATHLVGAQDSTQCGLIFEDLNAQTPQYGAGYWIDLVPNTQFWNAGVLDPCVTSPDSAVVVNYGMHHFIWVVVNGACRDSSDTVNIRFIELPHAYAGEADTICGLSYLLHAVHSVGTGLWSYCNSPGIANFMTGTNPDDQVCVSATGNYQFVWTEDNSNGCIDADTVNIFFDSPAFLYGQLLDISLPLGQNEGHVAAYIDDNGFMQFTGQGNISSSSEYMISFTEQGNYLLKGIVDDHVTYPNLMNTYYNSEIDWQLATPVSLQCGDSVQLDIQMARTAPITSGTGSVSGTIVYENTSDPVYKADVFLSDSLVNYPCMATQTDMTGIYQFTGIPAGSYEIVVDMPGIPLISSHHFTVTATNTQFTGYDFYVDTVISRLTGIGIYADTTNINNSVETHISGITVSVYPNPFADNVNIDYRLDNSTDVSLELIDVNGRTVKEMVSMEQQSGEHHYEISGLDAGIYYVVLKTGHTCYVKKILKQ